MNNVTGKTMAFTGDLKFGLIVIIPGDLLKCVIAALLGTKVIPVIKKSTA